jgi:hypothetical protein
MNTPPLCIQELIYAGQRMTDNSAVLATYHVPPGCQVCVWVTPCSDADEMHSVHVCRRQPARSCLPYNPHCASG